ncbi:MAG: hypothetical protein WC969_00510 [Elusimicrobiota bacterium]|jgi:hypothetical protein
MNIRAFLFLLATASLSLMTVGEAGAQPSGGVPTECARRGAAHWVQFEAEPRHVFLLKVNADDGSRSVLHYELGEGDAEQCREFLGPYAPGSPVFLALERLETELRGCCSSPGRPWLYLIVNEQAAWKKRILELESAP